MKDWMNLVDQLNHADGIVSCSQAAQRLSQPKPSLELKSEKGSTDMAFDAVKIANRKYDLLDSRDRNLPGGPPPALPRHMYSGSLDDRNVRPRAAVGHTV